MAEKILFVDDEPAVLDGYRRMLHREFEVDTAVGGEVGLSMIHDCGPYCVVISDMRMPGMNGAEFLYQVRQKSPDTVRMLLTGGTDLNAAIDAVNEGNIFRFLTKPCSKETIVEAIHIGLDQYHSITTEKKLAKKAQIIEESRNETADICQWDNHEGPTGLPGPTQARNYLTPLFGVDTLSYAVLFKLSMLQTMEQRYGEEVAGDYLNSAAQFLTEALRPDDKLYHWGRDVLMAVVRRKISPGALRMEIDRLTLASRGQVMNVNGKSIMIACPIAFDLLPVSQFSSLDDMLLVFEARPLGMI
jgi:FixJ family two-component response regulator/GGDEF domain-containing protein